MSNKLLRKVISGLSLCPNAELESLIKAELEESDLYTLLGDCLAEGHIVIDYSGIVIYYNKTVNSLVPTSSKHRISEGKSISDVINDKDINKFINWSLSSIPYPPCRHATSSYVCTKSGSIPG